MTVTLAAPKLPLVLPPGEAHAGEVVIADIGIPVRGDRRARRAAHRAADAASRCASSIDAARRRLAQGRLRPRRWSSPDRAARPARRTSPAMGALRSGAGLVTVATPESCLPIVASMAPEYMTEPLDETERRHVIAGRRSTRVLDLHARRHRLRPGPRPGRRRRRVRAVRCVDRGDGAAGARRRRDSTYSRDDPGSPDRPRRSATSSSRRIRARWPG